MKVSLLRAPVSSAGLACAHLSRGCAFIRLYFLGSHAGFLYVLELLVQSAFARVPQGLSVSPVESDVGCCLRKKGVWSEYTLCPVLLLGRALRLREAAGPALGQQGLPPS